MTATDETISELILEAISLLTCADRTTKTIAKVIDRQPNVVQGELQKLQEEGVIRAVVSASPCRITWHFAKYLKELPKDEAEPKNSKSGIHGNPSGDDSPAAPNGNAVAEHPGPE